MVASTADGFGVRAAKLKTAPSRRNLRPATFVIGDFEATPTEPNRAIRIPI
jgi:hypothetical protein